MTTPNRQLLGEIRRRTRLVAPYLAALLVTGPAFATDYTVTTTGDGGDGTCDGTCTLRDAVLAANAHSGTDTIILAAGTYTLGLAGTGEDAGQTGDLDITDNVIVSGDSRTTTIIDAATLDRALHILPRDGATAEVMVEISNLTIRNGRVSNENGGGIAIEQLGNLTLTAVNIEDNATTNPAHTSESGVGGGIFNDGTLTMTNCTVSGNTATVDQPGRAYAGGGGLHNGSNGNAVLQSVVITANAVVNAFGDFNTGGGVLNRGTLSIENNSTVGGSNPAAGNQAHSGAGISNVGGVLFVYNTTISYNTTKIETDPTAELGGEGGGGIFAQNAGTDRGSVFIDSSTISYNYADRQGGGIFNSGAPLTLTHSTVSDNRARYNGAGLANVSSVPAEITNSTFYGNRGADENGVDVVGSNGGAIYSSSRISVSSSTFYNNDAETGSQVYAARSSTSGSAPPQLTFTNTIISHGSNSTNGSNNCAADAPVAGDVDFIQSRDYNIDSGPAYTATDAATDATNGNSNVRRTRCFLSSNDFGDTAGFSDLFDLDPSVVFGGNALANNGGPTRTVALTGGSRAINRRELSACPGDDQRGYERKVLCDTGAYESDAAVFSRTRYDLKLTLTESADPVALGDQLTYTATVTNIGPDTASGVTVLVTLPTDAGLNLGSLDFAIVDNAPGTCNNVVTNEISCSLGTLTRRARVQVRVTVTPTIPTTLSVTAAVQSSNADSETFSGNNQVTETTEVDSTGSVYYPASGGGGLWSWSLLLLAIARRRPLRPCRL